MRTNLGEQTHQIRNALQVAGVTVDLLRRRLASSAADAETLALLDRLERQLVRIDSGIGLAADGSPALRAATVGSGRGA